MTNNSPLTTEQLAALKEVAEKAQKSDALASMRTLFSMKFNPTTCLELLKEIERLREIERESQALDKLTDRHLKSEVSEMLKL